MVAAGTSGDLDDGPQGGAFAVLNGNVLTVETCTFTSNSAAAYGGAVYSYGYATCV